VLGQKRIEVSFDTGEMKWFDSPSMKEGAQCGQWWLVVSCCVSGRGCACAGAFRLSRDKSLPLLAYLCASGREFTLLGISQLFEEFISPQPHNNHRQPQPRPCISIFTETHDEFVTEWEEDREYILYSFSLSPRVRTSTIRLDVYCNL
jgi:hypothetical protein